RIFPIGGKRKRRCEMSAIGPTRTSASCTAHVRFRGQMVNAITRIATPCFCSCYRMHHLRALNSPGGGALYYVVDRQLCVVCYRVADMPTPRVPSEEQRCANCCEPIWVAKKWPAEPAKICSQCTERDPLSEIKRA